MAKPGRSQAPRSFRYQVTFTVAHTVNRGQAQPKVSNQCNSQPESPRCRPAGAEDGVPGRATSRGQNSICHSLQ